MINFDLRNISIAEHGDEIQSIVNKYSSVVRNEHTETVSIMNRQLRALKMLVKAGVDINQPYKNVSEIVDLAVWGMESKSAAFHAAQKND